MNRILIIEDEQHVADLLRLGLEEMGYRASVAYDAEMGLRLFRAGQYADLQADLLTKTVHRNGKKIKFRHWL